MTPLSLQVHCMLTVLCFHSSDLCVQTADDVEWNTNHAQPCSEPSQVQLMSVPGEPGVNAVFCTQADFGVELFTSVNSLTDRFCCCPQTFCRCLSACFFFVFCPAWQTLCHHALPSGSSAGQLHLVRCHGDKLPVGECRGQGHV